MLACRTGNQSQCRLWERSDRVFGVTPWIASKVYEFSEEKYMSPECFRRRVGLVVPLESLLKSAHEDFSLFVGLVHCLKTGAMSD